MQSTPALNTHGLLEPGIYDLSLSQIESLFGKFQRTDRRLELFRRLSALVEEIGAYDFARRLIVDGSFITSKDEPSDIDLIFVVKEGTLPLKTMINPYEYNALSSRRLKKKYDFDVLVVDEHSGAYDHYIEYFSRLKEGPNDVRKGLVRLEFK
ncbi:MAG: hypothetical protein WBM28_01810 [Burkholderiales bacterium]